jgi:hypothetical protein
MMPRCLLPLILLGLALTSCSTVQRTVRTNAFRYGRKFVTQ